TPLPRPAAVIPAHEQAGGGGQFTVAIDEGQTVPQPGGYAVFVEQLFQAGAAAAADGVAVLAAAAQGNGKAVPGPHPQRLAALPLSQHKAVTAGQVDDVA